MDAQRRFLDSVEANHRAQLYKARWDEPTADSLLPMLLNLLKSTDSTVVLRTLFALTVVGPNARAAAKDLVPLLQSENEIISQSAAIALGGVSIRNPELAVQPLMEMCRDQSRLKYGMQALIGLGVGARSAGIVFAQAFDSKDARTRRWALRGLKETQAPAEVAIPILYRALEDRSEQIRVYARKILATHYSFPSGGRGCP